MLYQITTQEIFKIIIFKEMQIITVIFHYTPIEYVTLKISYTKFKQQCKAITIPLHC